MKTNPFEARIKIIGVNPYVLVPAAILKQVFVQAGKDKGKIPVRIKIDGHRFVQTLVKYSGQWRLYLNTPMRKAAKKELGDKAVFEVNFDAVKRVYVQHSGLTMALKKDPEAKKVFDSLSPSLRHEISRYISNLKGKESVDRNVLRAIRFLNGQERFIGRDKPR